MREPGVLVRRIESSTPVEREREVDGLRAIAILGVVFGHWIVTGVYAGADHWQTDSPLRHLPDYAPLTWLLQPLAVFFLVGGYVAAQSQARADRYRPWARRRMIRLGRPIAALLVVWTVSMALLADFVAGETLYTVGRLVLSPLWFVLVYAGLTALTPLVVRLGRTGPVLAIGTVLAVDLIRFAADGPAVVGWLNVLAGWLVPYSLGVLWAGPHRARIERLGGPLLVAGTIACAGLIRYGGYPVSMVGVPGEAISNLNPPTSAAVAFGLAQCGLALLVRAPLRRALRRHPRTWAVVALVNLSAMTVFLWHQSAMLAVTSLGIALGGLPGLGTVPDEVPWVGARIGWMPVFAGVLLGLWAVFHRWETGAPGRGDPRSNS
ncbi:acyltransferase family protein [Embleya scabrispora]|uniref:acyltransferase family protein n=1 Tax=Embleya scabrispora TaxID=159449 RepID=UPI00039B903E|nr:acyltransferase [Embleya scabrispora]MYS82871.1 acyltransferase family protein [Streptomyces sp. SID5474]